MGCIIYEHTFDQACARVLPAQRLEDEYFPPVKLKCKLGVLLEMYG
jgi:hypothetical protein